MENNVIKLSDYRKSDTDYSEEFLNDCIVMRKATTKQLAQDMFAHSTAMALVTALGWVGAVVQGGVPSSVAFTFWALLLLPSIIASNTLSDCVSHQEVVGELRFSKGLMHASSIAMLLLLTYSGTNSFWAFFTILLSVILTNTSAVARTHKSEVLFAIRDLVESLYGGRE